MITILSGTNNYLLRAELRQMIAVFEAEYGDMALERLDGEDSSYERIQESVQSLPFLSDRKMVVLLTPGASKQFAEKAPNLLQELPDTTDLIIVEPKLDKRSTYYKFLKKQSGFTEYNDLDEMGLAKWLVGLAREKQAQLGIADAKYLIERVGSNQQMLASEIEKLSLYQLDISRTAINALTVAAPQSTIFQLLEAAFAGNTRQALHIYGEQRALKVEPQQIIAMLAWQLHVLALIKAAGNGFAPDVIAREAKISPYVVRKSASIARKLTVARTKQLISDLLVIDERLKRESLNADDVLLDYLIRLAD
ncbi:MAG TPA: DNA polymerase III subunit delta [Candidatus Saccharimonadales bacterium]